MNAIRIAEGELAREAVHVLRKLMAPLARLVPETGRYALVAGEGSMAGVKKRLSVPVAIVDAFRRRDWIEPAVMQPDCFVLSDAELGWIRRTLAGSDAFAAQHRIAGRREIDGDGGRTVVTVNDGESTLGWLRRRKDPDGRPLIDDRQFAAGERLRSDFTTAQMSARMAVDLTAPVVAGRRGAKGDLALPEIVLAAKQRVRNALSAVGPGLSDLLLDACCHLTGLEEAEKQQGWPQRSAKVVLGIALDRLAAHYGNGIAVGTGSRIRAWSLPEGDGAKKFAREL